MSVLFTEGDWTIQDGFNSPRGMMNETVVKHNCEPTSKMIWTWENVQLGYCQDCMESIPDDIMGIYILLTWDKDGL